MPARSVARPLEHDDRPAGDQMVHLTGTFDDYETLLRIRGEKSVPRISYLEGSIQIVSPSMEHEELKSTIGRLVEAYCLHHEILFRAVGSWTLKERKKERGAEPDECYIFGEEKKRRPDLAIEVVWTSGGIDKLEIYRRLQVREVWIWKRGRIRVHGLRGDRYVTLARSEVLPGIDLKQLAAHLAAPTTYDAIVRYRAALKPGTSRKRRKQGR